MKSIIARILTALFISQPLFAFASESVAPVVPTDKFVVTAYYSPLPNQSYYMKGSYEADVILNGRGTNGASGKEVYIGMLAAPKKYPFGTKIHLEWLGVGVVDDRGGAIVNAGERSNAYDRIDIWMGTGEEGLRRALQWGRRTVKGKILDDWEATLAVDHIPLAPKSSIAGLRIENDQSDDVFDVVVDKKSSVTQIKKLEQILTDLGYYTAEIDGKWDKKIVDAIFDFQKEKKIVTRVSDLGAGYLGKKTRETLKDVYQEFEKLQALKKQEEAKQKALQEEKEKELAAKKAIIKKEILSLDDMKAGDVWPHIRALQKTLAKLGYLKEKDTAIFGDKTVEAVVALQQDGKIIEEKGIGFVWEKTKNLLVDRLMLASEK